MSKIIGTILTLIFLFSLEVTMSVGQDKSDVEKPALSDPQSSVSGPIEAAIRILSLKNLLEKDPENLSALEELGNLYFDTGKHKEAVETYSKYLAIKPNNANVRTDAAIMYRKLGQFDIAIEEFRKAAQSDPKHVNSRYNLAMVLFYDKQDIKGAIEAFEEYLRVEPEGDRAEKVKGWIEQLRKLLK